jgi:hypothetical protein
MNGTQSVNAALLPVAAADVVYKALPDGAVLFSSESEVYFGLNAVGARVWELLPPTTSTVGELVAELAKAYPDADVETIQGDVTELLEELQRQGLVAPRTGGRPHA